MSWRSERNLRRAGLAVLAAIATHVAQLDLWVDEDITLMLIQRWDLREMLLVLPVHQPHYPTYFMAIEVLGPGVMNVVSVVAFSVTAVVAHELALDEYGGDESALGAGLMVAISPFLAAQAGWLRMYALLTALMTGGLLMRRRGMGDRASAVYFLASALHPFGVIAPLHDAIAERTRRSAAWLAVSCLPGVLLAYAHTLKPGNPGADQGVYYTGVGHAIVPTGPDLLVTPMSTLVGAPHIVLQAVLMMAVTAVIASPPIRVVGRSVVPVGGHDWRLALWIVLPLVLIGGASHVHPIFRVKYFGFVAPAVAVLAVDPRRGRWAKWFLALSFTLLLALSWTGRVEGLIVARRIFVDF